jgi:hypothetical protein
MSAPFHRVGARFIAPWLMIFGGLIGRNELRPYAGMILETSVERPKAVQALDVNSES